MIGRILAVDMHPVCIAENERLTAEVLELVDEVRYLEDTVSQRDAELDVVREQLATEISRRCLGGSPPVSTPLWSNTNAKFAGSPPPPHPGVNQ